MATNSGAGSAIQLSLFGGEVIELKYCCSEDMVADMLTKGLPRERFAELRAQCGMTELNY